jgi:hypothetical protein
LNNIVALFRLPLCGVENHQRFDQDFAIVPAVVLVGAFLLKCSGEFPEAVNRAV